MGTLLNKANEILSEKTNKIIPENIKDGVEIFNITGNYTGQGGNPEIRLSTGIKFGYSVFNELPYTVNIIDTSNTTNMAGMFYSCQNLTNLTNLDVSNWNTSNVTNMQGMFDGCAALSTIPQLDTSSVTNMSRMFANCDALQSIPVLNYEEVTDTSSMFVGCTSLTTIPDEDLDAYNLTNTSGMFSGCGSLEIIPESFDVPESQNCSYMFANCASLTTVPMFGLEGVNSMSNMFYNCPLLSEDSLDNILGMLAYAIGGGYSGTKTLKWIGLSQSQANICETLYHWSDCQNRGWTTGYED